MWSCLKCVGLNATIFGLVTFSQEEKRRDKPEDMPEFHGNEIVGVLLRRPRVSEDGLKRTGWKFDSFYLDG